MNAAKCSHHWHEFLSRDLATIYCCRCGEFEDRRRGERPSSHFQYLDIVTRSYQGPAPGYLKPRLWKGLHERWSL